MLVVFGCALAVWLGSGAVDPRATLYRAEEEYGSGRLTDAVALFEQVSRYPGSNPTVALRLAEARLALARQVTDEPVRAFAQARDAWLDVLNFDEVDGSSYEALAEVYLALGDLDLAAEALEHVPLAAREVWLRQLLGAQLQKEDWAAAGLTYARIAAAEPDNWEAHFWAGALLMATEPSVAQQHLQQAWSDPVLQVRCERLLSALESVQDDPDRVYHAAQLGVAYLDIGEPGLARVQLLAAVEEAPTYADAWSYLGAAEDQLGLDGGNAIARAIDLEPDRPLSHSLMGHHWLAQGKLELARREFTTARDLDPDFPAHLADVAMTYQLEGDSVSAEAWYQAAVSLVPDDATFWILLAQFYLGTRSDVADNGLLVAQKAVALDPESPSALDVLGWAQFLSGQSRLAETNLNAARQRDEANPSIHYHLGRLYDEQGASAAAAEAYRRAIALDTSCQMCSEARQGPYADLAARALAGRGYPE